MPLVEGIVALVEQLEPDFPSHWVKTQLLELSEDVKDSLLSESNLPLRFAGLLRLFYGEWGFKGDTQQYFSSENAYIDSVLERKTGIPVSLGSIVLLLAQALELPVTAINFPTQLVLKVSWDNGETQYLNPFDGEFVSLHTMKSWLIGTKGPFAELRDEYLQSVPNTQLLLRWLTVIKGALLREDDYELALAYSDLSLGFKPGDPHEIRDRGYIYQQLDCDAAAVSDYTYFIEHCPDDPAAKLLELQIKVLNESSVVLH